MHLVKTLIFVARASHLALGAPSKSTSDEALESIEARQPVDGSQDEWDSADEYESMADDLVNLMADEGKSKEKYCKECHKICIAVSPVPPAVAA